jgi:hypothetical protein
VQFKHSRARGAGGSWEVGGRRGAIGDMHMDKGKGWDVGASGMLPPKSKNICLGATIIFKAYI